MSDEATDHIDNLYIAILAGGIGTRLWPRSRQAMPKQFADISGTGRTMIQSTVDRVAGLVPPERVFVVTGQAYANIAAEQLPELGRGQVIVEPSGRNTGPAIGLASIVIRAENPEAVIAVLPADHVISDHEHFRLVLRRATDVASDGWLTTLGITPSHPHTGYGYIQRGVAIGRFTSEPHAFSVERFHEKPDFATAEEFLASGDYYWNGGIFVYQVAHMLEELQRQQPQIFAGLQHIATALVTNSNRNPDTTAVRAAIENVWQYMTRISIDHGVMEGAGRVAVVPLDAGWNDVGSWDALSTIVQPDPNGNIVVGGNIVSIDSSNNIVYCNNHHVALIGVQDLVVVSTGDSILIGPKEQMQRVKEVVEELRARNRQDLL